MELKEVQGLLARGHSDLKAAAFVMLQINDPESFRHWLRDKLHWVTDGITRHGKIRVNIAFTYVGLKQLRVPEAVEQGFSVEFVQGMATSYRARMLGDEADCGVEKWNWGGPNNDRIDLVLMCYAIDAPFLKEKLLEFEQKYAKGGLTEVTTLWASWNPYGKEHFGFKDGIAQPYIKGLSKKGPAHNTVPTGEFVLGHINAYGKMPVSPIIREEKDPGGYLHKAKNKKGFRDFGLHGSYMVFRQLSQDVKGFWNQIKEAVDREKGGAENATLDDYIQLGAKMFGRWPNGKPISLSPEKETPYNPEEEDFLFTDNDPHGHSCPIGSHIRRANPRDALPDNSPKSAVRVSNRHRILRRGRPFGPPLVPDYDIKKMFETPDDGQDRGLLFICFNTNFSRQFEFIQHTWNNNPKYAGLYDDPDPVLGIMDARHKGLTHNFTMEAAPLRRKITDLRRKVHVLGGEYFFFPGFATLKYLAHTDLTSNES